MFAYERRRDGLLTHAQFMRRVFGHVVFAAGVVVIALSAGILGYHYIAGFAWIDALLDASMILGGMGPVGRLESDAAKVFASLYALFAGLVFIGVTATLLAPFLHRIMHRFHIDEAGK